MEHGIMEFTSEEKRKCHFKELKRFPGWSKGMHIPHCSVQVG